MPVDYVAMVGTHVGIYLFRFSLVQEAAEKSRRIDMVLRGRDDMIGVAKLLHILLDIWAPTIFVGSGQDCRDWCAYVPDKLAENKFVHHDVCWTFTQAETEEHNGFGSSYPMPRIRGTF
ncbi:hypothetical protein ACEPAG_3319 [Sanghuangporus baumii]